MGRYENEQATKYILKSGIILTKCEHFLLIAISVLSLQSCRQILSGNY